MFKLNREFTPNNHNGFDTLGKAIQSIIDTHLERFDRNHYLIFNFWSLIGNGKKGEKYDCWTEDFQVIIYRPNNYTRVLVFDKRTQELHLVIDHDSCWRQSVNDVVRYLQPQGVGFYHSISDPFFEKREVSEELIKVFQSVSYQDRFCEIGHNFIDRKGGICE